NIICPEFLAQPAVNAEIARPDVHDQGSVPGAST
ncbi:hypothetical protein A2U01_0036242, partial [Trifolium medium]|nr:hypothetical protein [Trifolium medium]